MTRALRGAGARVRFKSNGLGASRRSELFAVVVTTTYGAGDEGVLSFAHPNAKLARAGWAYVEVDSKEPGDAPGTKLYVGVHPSMWEFVLPVEPVPTCNGCGRDVERDHAQETPAADSGGAIPASTAAQPATGGAVENPPAASADECERCDGSGQISGRSQPVEGLAYMDWEADCDECGGTGRVAL